MVANFAVADGLRMLESITEMMMRQFPVIYLAENDVTADDECFSCLRFMLPDSYLHYDFCFSLRGLLVLFAAVVLLVELVLWPFVLFVSRKRDNKALVPDPC